MKKLLLILGILIIVAFAVSGCTFSHEHNKSHIRAFFDDTYGDLEEMHRFVDKYLFNYNERDPYRY